MLQEAPILMDVEDLEDLLNEIEEIFDIRFDLDKIYNRISVGEIIDMIIEKSGYAESKECAHQIIFFRLRNELTSHLSVPSGQIQLNTPLEKLFPEKGRRESWAALFRFAPIKRRPPLNPGNYFWIPIVTLLLTPLLAFILNSWLTLVIQPIISIFIIYIMLRKAKKLPCKTVGELVQLLIRYNYLPIRLEFGTFNRSEVEKIVCSLIDSWVVDDNAPITAATRIEYEEKK